MAIPFFFPSMYEPFIDGVIEHPHDYGENTFEACDEKGVLTILEQYPNFGLFLCIHLGCAFTPNQITENAKAIAKIPEDKARSMCLDPNLDAEELKSFGVDLCCSEVWD